MSLFLLLLGLARGSALPAGRASSWLAGSCIPPLPGVCPYPPGQGILAPGEDGILTRQAGNILAIFTRLAGDVFPAWPGGGSFFPCPGFLSLPANPGGVFLPAWPGGSLSAWPGGSLSAWPRVEPLPAWPGTVPLLSNPGGVSLLAGPGLAPLPANPGGIPLPAWPGGVCLSARPGGFLPWRELPPAPGESTCSGAPGAGLSKSSEVGIGLGQSESSLPGFAIRRTGNHLVDIGAGVGQGGKGLPSLILAGEISMP